MRVFALVQREFEKAGITKAELADRLERGADRVSHLLGAPGNWTLDTVSDLLFAISGAEINYHVTYPLQRPSRNMTTPEWLYSEPSLLQVPIGGEAAFQTIYPQADFGRSNGR